MTRYPACARRGWSNRAPSRAPPRHGRCEQLRQRRRIADRKAFAFIERRGRRIEGSGGIPEMAHQLHLAGIIPDVERDRAARSHHPAHFAHRLGSVRNEIEHEAGDRGVMFRIGQRQLPRIARFEPGPRIADLIASEGEKAVGGIDAHNRSRFGPIQNIRTQRTGAAAHIDPAQTAIRCEPIEERAPHEAAPAAYILFVGIADRPGFRLTAGLHRSPVKKGFVCRKFR